MDKVSYELSAQPSQFKLSMESPVDDPESTLASFNRQFGLNAQEKEAVEWAWPMEMGGNMFAIVNTYTRARREKRSKWENHRVGPSGTGGVMTIQSIPEYK